MFLLYFHNFSAENMTFKLTLHVHTPENPEIQDHKAIYLITKWFSGIITIHEQVLK